MRKLGVLAFAALCIMPLVAGAQQSNEGASVTAPFMAVPPVIDGVMSSGEWDNAGVAPGQWTGHSDTNPEPASSKTEVRVAYSVDGLYIIYICTDSQPASAASGSEVLGANTFAFGGATDYIATYLACNYVQDSGPTYSIQIEPSKTAKNAVDALGNSYTYTELGQWGGKRLIYNPPRDMGDGTFRYSDGGGAWDLKTSKVLDGPITGGFCVEWKITWGDLVPMTDHAMGNAAQIEGPLYEVYLNGDAVDPIYNQWFTIRSHVVNDDGSYNRWNAWGGATGMPLPGTKWYANFCRYNQQQTAAGSGYTNWVGDTSSFVTFPYGTIIFGPASGTDVANATLHMQ